MAKLVVPALPLPSDGMCMDNAQHVLRDTFCFYSQDFLFDVPGRVRTRGAVTPPPTAPSLPTTGNKAIGITSMTASDGTNRMLIVYRSGSTIQFKVLNASTGTGLCDLDIAAIHGIGDLATNQWFVDVKPALGGGRLISITPGSSWSTTTNKPTVYYWRGAAKNSYSTGTVSVTQGSKTVTGSGTTWTSNVEPGMFLYVSGAGSIRNYVGVVQKIDSNTSITLEEGAAIPTVAGASYQLHSFRTLLPVDKPWITEGLATSSTGSATVTGGNTKWRDQSVTTSHSMFRSSDMAFVGTVATVNSNISITLAANAAVALDGEEYVLIPTGVVPGSDIPVYHAFWRGYQFLANWNSGRSTSGYRAPISGASDTVSSALVFIRGPRFIDEGDPSQDGSFIPLQPSAATDNAIRGLAPTQNALLAFFGHETHVIQGTSPDDFSTRLLYSDGVLSSQSIVPYKDGVVWAGNDSVYYYDGITVNDLLAGRVRNYYRTLRSMMLDDTEFPPTYYGFIQDDHYVLNFHQVNANDTNAVPLWRNGSPTSTPGGRVQLVINLNTGAVGTFSNVYHLGAASDGNNDQWILFNKDGTDYLGIAVASAKTVFNKEEPPSVNGDLINTVETNNTFGPLIYLETKMYDMGNPELKKLFRQAQFWLETPSVNNRLNIDVFGGVWRGATSLNTPVVNVPIETIGTYTVSNQRKKFLIRDTHIALRFYASAATPGSILFAWAFGFKPMRPGRV